MQIIKKKQQYYLVKAKFNKLELRTIIRNIGDTSIKKKCRILLKDLKNG